MALANKNDKLPKVISYLDLETIKTTRQEITSLQDQLKRKKIALEAMEGRTIAILENGGYCKGGLVATVEETQKVGKRQPAWKNLFGDHLMKVHSLTKEQVEANFKRVVQATKAKITVTKNLIIKDRCDGRS